MTPELLQTLYRRMLTVRRFDDRHVELLHTGRFPMPSHPGTGQEAVAIGVTAPLRPDDFLFGSHRGVGEFVGKGMAVRDLWAEFLLRATAPSRGKAGLHLTDRRVGIPGIVGGVGTDFSLAVGAAGAFRLQGTDRVSVDYFSEGAATGADLGPALNMAALWQAPVIFALVNNQYSELSHYREITPTEDLAPRAGAFGVPFEIVPEGNDIEAVYDAMSRAVDRARSGGGPTFIEFKSYRVGPHFNGDPAAYQPKQEIAAWRARDPIAACERLLLVRGWATEAEVAAMKAAAADEVEAGLAAAMADPEPAAEELLAGVEPLDPWEVSPLRG